MISILKQGKINSSFLFAWASRSVTDTLELWDLWLSTQKHLLTIATKPGFCLLNSSASLHSQHYVQHWKASCTVTGLKYHLNFNSRPDELSYIRGISFCQEVGLGWVLACFGRHNLRCKAFVISDDLRARKKELRLTQSHSECLWMALRKNNNKSLYFQAA